ncbi:hypothetical protein BJH93_06720, partial [Kocuria polaris]|nr:hypothetical protein [Kocuria polaris]
PAATGPVAAASTTGLELWLPSPATPDSPARVLTELDYRAEPGAVNVILGASGAGKSLLLRTLTGLLPDGARTTGAVALHGRTLTPEGLAAARGTETVLVPGSAATALNPVRTVAAQMRQTLKSAKRGSTPADVASALAAADVDPSLASCFPHELSGGQAQRVVLALGVAVGARVLLVDEPTSALDAESSARIEELLRAQAACGTTVIMVTHDLAMTRRIADLVAVVHDGRVVEAGRAEELLAAPGHPATAALLGGPA